jgi:hypothetical protein
MPDFMRKISSKRDFKKLKLVARQTIGRVSAYKKLRGVGGKGESKNSMSNRFFLQQKARNKITSAFNICWGGRAS